ncbi:hypothetical protein Tco_0585506 [Tanacetum coccineum]
MAAPKFAETHNLVAFLDKPTESEGFEQIIDFFNANPIKYALTVNPTIYTTCIEQFWATAKAKTVNGERQIQALVDKQKVIITEKSVRSDLKLKDAEAPEEMGEDSVAPTDSHSTPIITQPSSSKPQKKKSRRKQRKDSGPTEPIPDEATNEEPISTPSYDPPQSGEDRLQLTELTNLCTSLQEKILDLEKAKTAQAKEIANVTLIDETQERNDEDLMFNTDVLNGDEVFEEPIVNAAKTTTSILVSAADPVTIASEVVTTASATTTVDELTLAHTLIEIKAAKPKAVTTAATTITTTVASTRPKAKGIVFHDQEEKAPAFTNKLDSIQAMIEADEQLAARLQAEEQEQFSIEEKSRMLVEMIAERKKFFAAQRAAEQRRRSYEEIQKLFDKAYKQVNSFVPIDSEVVKSSETRTEGSSKREGDELESDKSKKQKIDVYVEAEKDNNQEEAEIKKHIEIVKDDEVAIDVIPLATKPPMIVEYKIVKEGKFGYFQLIRSDGSSKRYLSIIKMLQNIDREDLETLWKLVKAKHGNTRPEEEYERVLWGDLKVMFEPDIKSQVWRNLQGYKVTIWKLFNTYGVHFVRFKNLHIFMLVEKRYPLTLITITNMLNKKLQADHWNEMCYQLLKLMTKQEKGQ